MVEAGRCRPLGHDGPRVRAASREPREPHAWAHRRRERQGRGRASRDVGGDRRGRRTRRGDSRAGEGGRGLAALDRGRGRGRRACPGGEAEGERCRARSPVLPRHQVNFAGGQRSRRGRGPLDAHDSHGQTRTERKLHYGTFHQGNGERRTGNGNSRSAGDSRRPRSCSGGTRRSAQARDGVRPNIPPSRCPTPRPSPPTRSGPSASASP